MASSIWSRGQKVERVQSRRRARLQMEPLEDRTVPSSLNIVEVEPNNASATANVVALGFDRGEDTRVIVNGSIGASGDHDWFRVELNAGDVISAGVRAQNGLDPTVGLWKPEGAPGARTQLDFNDNSFFTGWRLLPSESPLSRLSARYTDPELYYVINAPGSYFIEVAASAYAPPENATGDYHMELVLARPGLEAQPVGAKQILFVDFDGAAINMSDFGRGWSGPATGTARLSPLPSFLANWGLTAADENAVIDATLATIRENLYEDMRERGLNDNFDLEIRNSRDHADEFGKNPFVSRIVIGGTREEVGAFILVGFSEVIDPGNFSFDDQAIVLLDDLSGPADSWLSLNQYDIGDGHTKAELVGLGLGSLAVHEAGHFFGNFHTWLYSDRLDLMDGDPYSLDATLGVGPDGWFGTADDIDVDFGVDDYTLFEQFRGRQDALNTIAFGLSTGKGPGTSLRTGVAGPSSSGSPRGRDGFVAFGFDALGLLYSMDGLLHLPDIAPPLTSQPIAPSVYPEVTATDQVFADHSWSTLDHRGVSTMPTSALARRADWLTDVLMSAELSGDGQDAAWAAR